MKQGNVNRFEAGPARPSRGTDGVDSVITVAFESGTSLAACVGSVLVSTAPVEVFVVDNASKDGGLTALRICLPADETRVTILENDRNVGFARANNQALPLARGEYLLFLNPDCLVEPDTLARLRAVMDVHPGAGMAGCLVLNPDGTEQPGCRRESPTPAKAFVRAFGLARWAQRLGVAPEAVRDFVRTGDPLPPGPIAVDAVAGAFIFVRRTALERVGPLDEGYFLHCEDLDWCERCRRAGYQVLFVPDVTITHEKGGSSRNRPVRVLWHMHRGMIRYYQKFFREAYPRPFMWLVFAGVWLRFSALAVLALARQAVHGPLRRERA